MELNDYEKRIIILRDLSGSYSYGKYNPKKNNPYTCLETNKIIKSLAWLDNKKTSAIYSHCSKLHLNYCETVDFLGEKVSFLEGVADSSIDCLLAGLIWSKQYDFSCDEQNTKDKEKFNKYYKQICKFEINFDNPLITKEEFLSTKYNELASYDYQTKFSKFLHDYISTKCPNCPEDDILKLMGKKYSTLFKNQSFFKKLNNEINETKNRYKNKEIELNI